MSIDESFIHLGERGFLGRRKGMGEQTYVDRCIDLRNNNTSRPERAAVYLFMNHSSVSAREDSPGRGENLGLRTERTLERRERRAAVSPLTPHQSRQ